MNEFGCELLDVIVEHFDVGMVVAVYIVGDGIYVSSRLNASCNLAYLKSMQLAWMGGWVVDK